MNLQEAMEKIENAKKKTLYEKMWRNNNFALKQMVKGTKYHGNESNNSYQFILNENESEKDLSVPLKRLFGIRDTEMFKTKFEEACGGSGNEALKILTLHSSSLCALLFFYDVKQHHLEIPLKVKGECKTFTFDDVYFEYQNKVINNPSNIDVTLLGNDDRGKPVILFLESKFSEYYLYSGGVSSDISCNYFDNDFSKLVYKDFFLGEAEYEKKASSKEGYFKLSKKGKSLYIDGLKQMVSHYVGVKNFMNKEDLIDRPENRGKEAVKSNYFDKNAIILLGTIVFDHIIGDFTIKKAEHPTYLESYADEYSKLVEFLNGKEDAEKLYILPELLCYSKIKDSKNVGDDILKFYSLEA